MKQIDILIERSLELLAPLYTVTTRLVPSRNKKDRAVLAVSCSTTVWDYLLIRCTGYRSMLSGEKKTLGFENNKKLKTPKNCITAYIRASHYGTNPNYSE